MNRKVGRDAGGEVGRDAGGEVGVAPVSERQDIYEHMMFMKEKVGDQEQGRVNVQRRLKDGTLVTLPSLPAKTFDTDLVAQRYGGGRYYIRFYLGREYLGDDHFTIDESVQPLPPEVIARDDGPSPKSNGDGGAGVGMMVLLREMMDELKQLKATPAPAAAPVVDPMAMIEKLAVTMKALAPAPVAALAPASFKDEIDRATSIITLGKTLMGEGGDGGRDSGDGYMSAITELSKPIVELVKVRAAQEAARLPRLVPSRVIAPVLAPPGAGNTVTASVPVAALPGGDMWFLEVQKWVPLIVKRALKGMSAESTAHFVVEELSEPTRVKLAALAEQEDFLDQLLRVLPPELQQRPLWVQEFAEVTQDLLLGVEDEEPEAVPVEAEVIADEPARDLAAEAAHKLSLLTDQDAGKADDTP